MKLMLFVEYTNERDKEGMGLYGIKEIVNDDNLNKTVTKMSNFGLNNKMANQ